jgi:Protein of unknown function (DUF4239)
MRELLPVGQLERELAVPFDMSPIALACLVFAGAFGSAMVAMLLRRVLPGHHLDADSQSAIKQGLALIATLTALVLGLLVASAKGTYDTQNGAVKQMAANVLLLDRILAAYGKETKEARELLRRAVTVSLERIWSEDSGQSAKLAPGESRAVMEAFYENVANLSPQSDSQRALKSRAMDLTIELTQMRLRLFAQKDSSIPTPFLLVLGCWLLILFAGFGLLAPGNTTVIAVLFICALSMAGAVFLILELDQPFGGIMQVSNAPVKEALSRLGQ